MRLIHVYRRFVIPTFIILSSIFLLEASTVHAAEDYVLFTNEFYSNTYIINTTTPNDNGMRVLDAGDRLTVSAAKNEIQSASFAVFNNSGVNLQNINLSVSDLVKGTAVIPSSQITPYVVKVARQRNSLRDNRPYTWGTVTVPEFLMPQSPAYKNRNEWDVGNNKSKQFWLDIEVPATAEAGTYIATITIAPDNGVAKTIPLRLTVHNFILQKSSQKVNGLFFTPNISVLDCIRVNPCQRIDQINEAGDYRQYIRKQFALMSKYGVQMIESQAKPTISWDDETSNVVINWTKYRQEMEGINNFGLNKKPIPYVGAFYDTPKKIKDKIDEKMPGATQQQKENKFAAAYGKLLREAVSIAKDDYQTDIAFYLIDEPFLNPGNTRDRERLIEQVTELKRLLPTAKTWGTISFENWWGYYNDFKQYFNYLTFDARVDNWKTRFATPDAFRDALVQDPQNRHIGQMYFNDIGPADVTGHRIKHGLFLWMLPLEANIPWTYQNIIADPFNDLDESDDYPDIDLGDAAGRHGDRMLAYPDFFNGMTPMPAMQLVGLREGSTDLSYIETLQYAISVSTKAAVKTQARNYLNDLKDDLARSGDSTVQKIARDHPPANLRQFRNTVADYIEQLDVQLPLSTPTPSDSPSPTSTPPSLPGDIDGDGDVDIFDYGLLVADFGKTGSAGFVPADIDKNGKVDIFDYTILVADFGKTIPTPSPSTLPTITPLPSLSPTPTAPPLTLERVNKFIWVEKLGAQFTDTEFNNLAQRYDLVVIGNAHNNYLIDGYNEVARRLTSLNPNIKVFPYYNTPRRFNIINSGTGFNDAWYLRDLNGNLVYDDGAPDHQYYDLSNANYRNWAVNFISNWVNSAPFAGIALDDANPQNLQSWKDKIGNTKANAWNAGRVEFVRQVKEALGSKIVIYNGIARNAFTGDVYTEYLDNNSADGALNEFYCYNRNSGEFLLKSWIAGDMNFMQNYGRIKDKILLQKVNLNPNLKKHPGAPIPPESEKRHISRFCLGAFLMGYVPNATYYKAGPGYGVAIGEIDVNALEINLNLGSSLGNFSREGQVYKREFQNGAVFVNLEDTEQTITVPRPLFLANGGVKGQRYNAGDAYTIPSKDAVYLVANAAFSLP